MLENWLFITVYITLAGKEEMQEKRARENGKDQTISLICCCSCRNCLVWRSLSLWTCPRQNFAVTSMDHTVAGSVDGGVGFSNLGDVSGCHGNVAGLVQHTCGSVHIALVHVSLNVLCCQFCAVSVSRHCSPLPIRSSPHRICYRFRPFRRLFMKRVKKKLLTLDEYERQGRVETEAALNELQEYCRHSRSFWKFKLNKLEDSQQ